MNGLSQLPPSKVTFRLDAELRHGLARIMEKRGVTLSQALRLAVERMLESEGLPGFQGAEARAGFKEGVRMGAAAVEQAVANLLHQGGLNGTQAARALPMRHSNRRR